MKRAKCQMSGVFQKELRLILSFKFAVFSYLSPAVSFLWTKHWEGRDENILSHRAERLYFLTMMQKPGSIQQRFSQRLRSVKTSWLTFPDIGLWSFNIILCYSTYQRIHIPWFAYVHFHWYKTCHSMFCHEMSKQYTYYTLFSQYRWK
jgi:hypothetical protein